MHESILWCCHRPVGFLFHKNQFESGLCESRVGRQIDPSTSKYLHLSLNDLGDACGACEEIFIKGDSFVNGVESMYLVIIHKLQTKC